MKRVVFKGLLLLCQLLLFTVREVTFVAYTDEEQRAATAVCDKMFSGDSATCRDSEGGIGPTSMSCVGMGK